MKSWMKEKDNVLSNEDVGRDMETVRVLQRRHQVRSYYTLHNHGYILEAVGWGRETWRLSGSSSPGRSLGGMGKDYNSNELHKV